MVHSDLINSVSKFHYDVVSNTWSIGDLNQGCSAGPLTACIQLTRKCNMSCKYCFEPYDDDLDIGIRQLEQVIASLAAAGSKLIRLTGGEPFLYRHIEHAVRMVNDYGMNAAIDTNATILSRETIKRFKKKVAFYAISMDGGRFVNDKYRGNYLSVRSAIEQLRGDGIPVLISAVLTDQSISDVIELVQFAQEVGALSLRIVPMLKRGKGLYVKTGKAQLQTTDFVSELRQYKLLKGIGLKIIIIDWFRVLPGSVIMIKKNGDMIGMPGLVDVAGEVFIGNVLSSTVSEVWRDYNYKMNHINKCLEQTVDSV